MTSLGVGRRHLSSLIELHIHENRRSNTFDLIDKRLQ